MGAQLKQDDIVEHFFVGSTHDWILFFTNKGRVYRAKAYELPEANRTARGQHVANILAFQPDEKIAQVIADQGLHGRAVPGAGHRPRAGEEDPADRLRLPAPGRRHRDQPARRRRAGRRRADRAPSRTCCWSPARRCRSASPPTTPQLRPMGRATEGVRGISLSDDDRLLSMMVVQEGVDVLVATERRLRQAHRHRELPGRRAAAARACSPPTRRPARVRWSGRWR